MNSQKNHQIENLGSSSRSLDNKIDFQIGSIFMEMNLNIQIFISPMIKLCTHELKKKKEEKITTKKPWILLDSKIDLSSWLINPYDNKIKYTYW